MIRRPIALTLFIAATLTLTACAGGEETVETPSEAPVSDEVTTDDTTDTSTESTVDDSGFIQGCDQILTAAEIDAIFGTTVEISGSSKTCSHIFADDSVGSFRVFTGAQADEAMELFLPRFIEDEDASANGVLFADDRGFIDGWSVVALGDSDRVFTFDAPDNLDVADLPAAMQKVADLLLVR